MTGGVSNPMTPEESKGQVIAAANEIVGTLELNIVKASFRNGSCSDNNKGPFRGVVNISYPKTDSFAASDAEIAQMVRQLQGLGWSGESDFRSHGTVLEKNNVVAVFVPQNVSSRTRTIALYGECRDVTTTKDTIQRERISFD